MKHRRHRGILKAGILKGEKRLKNQLFRLMELAGYVPVSRLGKYLHICCRRLKGHG